MTNLSKRLQDRLARLEDGQFTTRDMDGQDTSKVTLHETRNWLLAIEMARIESKHWL